jgi:ADP-L-glycero-D-manno-heptose 6-epimerase
MYIVTGGAGFIGSNLVRGLNARGIADILVVDDLTSSAKFQNLTDCQIVDYMDKGEFLRALDRAALPQHIEAILHQGACTDTMESDGRYMMENNFSFSRSLLQFALAGQIPFVYASSASVYGAGNVFREAPEHERPLNVYGFSKQMFDQYVRGACGSARSTVVGLRYFNVFGPRERHKGRMASMVYQLDRQLAETGRARLFEGTDGYGDGEQRRDFIFVADVVKLNLFFAHGPATQGVFNAGTGQSRSFNEIARALIRLRGEGRIEYVPFDQALCGKYQSFTEADLCRLRAAGYQEPFTPLEEGISASVKAWESELAAGTPRHP